jgi:hypothetical protein
MTTPLKILILGGYGTFGGRLAQLLADEKSLTLIIAGRSLEKASAFCASLAARATLVPQRFDRDGDLEAQLAGLAPDIIVDASGPFQMYRDPYKLVRAALARGIHYLDLADGSDFVKGVAQFDAQAKARGVFVLSGVSSFPVLTAAVMRRLAQGLARVDTVTAGIAPSPYAGVGLNVIRAIASYAGRPIAIPRSGIHYGLTEARRYTVAPPGCVPLKPIRFSLVDVPDLKVLPELWPDLKSVWVGAGPVPGILHRALNGLAWAVRLKLLPSLTPFASLMFWVINVVRWGEHRGGMFVEVEGTGADGARVERSWHLLAEGDDGPLIPSMAAEAIIRHCLAGRPPAVGARSATGDLEVSDYEALFARRRILTGVRERAASSAPLYRHILGDAWNRLPAPLQTMHDLTNEMTASGLGEVERGKGWLAKLAATLFRFPPSGRDIPITVSFYRNGGREIWRRDFAGNRFASTQWEGRGRYERLLCERFGPITVALALVVEDGRLVLVPRGWTLLGLPMPLRWAPGGNASEYAKEGRFWFDVEIDHPLTGVVVRYRGWLEPCR